MSSLLKVEELRIRFRTKGPVEAVLKKDKNPFIEAVHGVSFSLRQGETYGLVGESGSGKTTLILSILGLVPVSYGRIWLNETELTAQSASAYKRIRREIGVMFQDPIASLSPRMTIASLLAEPFKVHGVKEQDLHSKIKSLLEMVNLSEAFMYRYPHQLSGGQARRVGVARALALSPKLIVADEPTAGLDVSVQGEILNLLDRLQKETGVTLLIITHNLHVVRHVSDRMGIMYLGKIIESGESEKIFDSPLHPYTTALLSATPDPDPDAPSRRINVKGEIPSLFKRPSGCEFHTRCPYSDNQCRSLFPKEFSAHKNHSVYCHYPLQ